MIIPPLYLLSSIFFVVHLMMVCTYDLIRSRIDFEMKGILWFVPIMWTFVHFFPKCLAIYWCRLLVAICDEYRKQVYVIILHRQLM